jgi:hypothetical protein
VDGVDDVLPRLRRLLGLHLRAVVADAGESDAGHAVVAGRGRLIFGLVVGVLGRQVLLPAALLLEVDGWRDVRELEHVDAEAARRPLRGDLGVERAGLQPHVAGLDLREVLAERVQQRGDGGLAVVAVVDKLALGLGLVDVRARVEVQHLAAAHRALGRDERHVGHEGSGGGKGPGFQKPAPGDGVVLGHAEISFWFGAIRSPAVA